MKIESPGPSSPANDDITSAVATYNNTFFTSLAYDATCDLNSDLTLMPQYFAESPASSLSTPTTQTSFEDFQSSSSSTYNISRPESFEYFDNALLTPFIPVKEEPCFFEFDEYEYPYHLPESIHRSIEMPASPLPEFQQSFLS